MVAGVAQVPRVMTGSGKQPLAAFLQRYLTQLKAGPDTTTRFTAASLGVQAARPAVVVYVSGRTWCGTGGCMLLVLEPTASTFRVLGRTTITRPPIRVLRSAHHGLPDLSVSVAGGGIRQPYVAVLTFDGVQYPSSPTIPPARRASVPASGRVVIHGEVEGERLYSSATNHARVVDHAPCGATLPSGVSAFVQSEAARGWNVVTLRYLVADDQRCGRNPMQTTARVSRSDDLTGQ